MSKRVQQPAATDSAASAVIFFRNCLGFKDAIQKILITYRGKISGVKLIKLKKGVSEVCRIKFPDHTAVNINKYIPNDGDITVSIKKEA